ncbi:ralf-like 32 [Prunus dulcis]|uniref:Ralf-like 32 n=1 Tax=Prunus dulcis TaxID=3755 RepID=A0A4Y1QNH7_PRUDU|nr:ralf-like 32 [Prunus dulcis]
MKTLLVPLLLQALASHSRASYTETGTHGYKEHCSGENGEEFKMEYETSRRFLAVQKFLSPGVLKRDLPVCKGPRGKPYGISCLPPPSNPRKEIRSFDPGCQAGDEGGPQSPWRYDYHLNY